MKSIHWIVSILVIIGALNWGLIGFFQFDLVAELFHGSTSWIARAIYSIIGLAGLFKLKCCFSCNKCCR